MGYRNNGTAGADLKYIKNSITNLKLTTGAAIDFISANSNVVNIGDAGNIKSVVALIKLDSTTQKILQLSATANLEASAGALSVTGWTGTNIYVNNVDTDIIGTNWALVVVTSSTSVTADDVKLGLIGANYGDFLCAAFGLSANELSMSQISQIYNNPLTFIEVCNDYSFKRIYPILEGKHLHSYPVFDYSGNNNHGTFNSSAPSTDANVVIDKGMQSALWGSNYYYWFDGVDDSVTLSSTIDYGSGGFDFTIVANVAVNNIHFLNTSTSNSPRLIWQASNRISLQNAAGLFVFSPIVPLGTIQSFRFVRVGNNLTLHIDGIEIETIVISGVFSFDLIGGKISTTSVNTLKGAILSFQDSEHFFRNENEFQDETGDITTTINGSPDKLRILPSNAKGTTDILANPVQNKWTEGLLNFTGVHLGGQIGDQVSSLDVVNGRVIYGALEYKTSDIAYLLINRNADDGFVLVTFTANRLYFLNEVKGVTGALQATMTIGNTYFYCIYQPVSGDSKMYLSLINEPVVASSDSGDIGLIGKGSIVPQIGVKSNFTENANSVNIPNIILDTSTEPTLKEINNIRKYFKSIFDKIL